MPILSKDFIFLSKKAPWWCFLGIMWFFLNSKSVEHLSTIHCPRRHLLVLNNGNTRTMCEICSKLTIKIPLRHHWSCFGIFILNIEMIPHTSVSILTLNKSCRLEGESCSTDLREISAACNSVKKESLNIRAIYR